MKIYYNLKLIEEVKQNTYQDLLLSPKTDPQVKVLALEDELELKDTVQNKMRKINDIKPMDLEGVPVAPNNDMPAFPNTLPNKKVN